MKTILELLNQRAATHPHAVACRDEQESRTFSEWAHDAYAIGTALLRLGAKNEPVAVFLPRGVRMLASFLGVLAAGCFYVPLEAELGELRLKSILATASPRFLICDAETEALAKSAGFTGAALSYDALRLTTPDEAALLTAYQAIHPFDPAYIVFTSGSTGTPKGVVGHHAAMLDYAEQLVSVLRPDETDVFGMQAPLYVDACLKELLCCLSVGARIEILPKRLFSWPIPLVEALNERNVTIVCWVVPALTLLSSLRTFDAVVPHTLKTVAFGSEVFPPKQLEIWQKHVPARYLNLYGPTECTGMSCYYEVDRPFSEGERIPIGRPFCNTTLYLLDENDRPASEGEICITGVCVCHGYYRDKERTALAFTKNPISPDSPYKLYRTGDLGAYNERGELMFLGRKDHQIKHMGHRIELGELEAAACAVSGVLGACAVFDAETKRLGLCFFGSIAASDLLKALKSRVPDYLLPSRTLLLERLPLTNNGKTDRTKCTQLCFHKGV